MRDTLVMRQRLEAMALYASHSRRSADGSAAMLQVSFPEGAMEGVVKRQLRENEQVRAGGRSDDGGRGEPPPAQWLKGRG